EDSEACANRSLVIIERIPGQADSRVEIPNVRIRRQHVLNRREPSRGQWIDDHIERSRSGPDGVRGERVSQTEIDRQSRRQLPFVLNVRDEVNLAEIAGGGESRRRRRHPKHTEWRSIQEILERAEGEIPADVGGRGEVGLNPRDGSAELETVRSAVQDTI